MTERAISEINKETIRRINNYLANKSRATISFPEGAKLKVLEQFGFKDSKHGEFYDTAIAIRIPHEAYKQARDGKELKAFIMAQIQEAFK